MSVYFDAETAERLVEILETPFNVRPYKGIMLAKASIREFDAVQPFVWVDKIYTPESEKEIFFFSDVTPAAFEKQITQSLLVQSKDSDCQMGFVAIRSVLPKEVRGRVKYIAPYMLRYVGGVINLKRREIVTQVTFWALKRHEEESLRYGSAAVQLLEKGEEIDFRKLPWEHITANLNLGSAYICEANSNIQIGLGVAFTNEHIWRVYLREENGIGIALPTTPEGTKEIFRLRDIPPGKNRRTALINWVREHCRRHPYKEDEKIFVRKHLRGAREFTWNGLYCKILLPLEAQKELQRAGN